MPLKGADTDLQVHSGRDSQIKADIHFCWNYIVGHSPLHHCHVNSCDITKCETLIGVKPKSDTYRYIDILLFRWNNKNFESWTYRRFSFSLNSKKEFITRRCGHIKDRQASETTASDNRDLGSTSKSNYGCKFCYTNRFLPKGIWAATNATNSSF